MTPFPQRPAPAGRGAAEDKEVIRMNWRTWYKEHLFTPEQAVQQIKSGQRVVVAHACGEPSIILDAMVANAAQYENVEIIHMVAMGKAA